MKVGILPKDNFTHGRQEFTRGQAAMVNQADAEDLARAGLVELTGSTAPDELDDVLGQKMEPIASNKMAPAAGNKQGNRK